MPRWLQRCHTHPSFAPGGDPFNGETEIVNTRNSHWRKQFGRLPRRHHADEKRPADSRSRIRTLLRTGEDEAHPASHAVMYTQMTQLDLRRSTNI